MEIKEIIYKIKESRLSPADRYLSRLMFGLEHYTVNSYSFYEKNNETFFKIRNKTLWIRKEHYTVLLSLIQNDSFEEFTNSYIRKYITDASKKYLNVEINRFMIAINR